MKKNEKVYYDKGTDIFWISFKSGEESSFEEYAPGVIVEFNAQREIIGIEIQGYSRLFKIDQSSSSVINRTVFNLGSEDSSYLNYTIHIS